MFKFSTKIPLALLSFSSVSLTAKADWICEGKTTIGAHIKLILADKTAHMEITKNQEADQSLRDFTKDYQNVNYIWAAHSTGFITAPGLSIVFTSGDNPNLETVHIIFLNQWWIDTADIQECIRSN